MQVRTPAFACKISIVRWSGERDSFSGTSEHVRDRVGEGLELVRHESDFVVDDIVVCGTDCALKTVVRLEEEIEICRLSVNLTSLWVLPIGTLTVNSGDTPINNSPWPRVSILIRELRVSREEPRVMPLSTDDDCQLWSIWLFGIPEGLESFDHLWILFFNNGVELSL